MNLRVFRYYTINHPLIRNRKIIISNRNEIQKTRNNVYEISKNRNTDRPRLIRVHISGEKEDYSIDSERIRTYEKIQSEREKIVFNRVKLYEILCFSRSFIIAYLLFLAPQAFWLPIVSLFNLVAHGLSDYARWCIIAFFPIKAIIKCFGTFIYIKTPEGLPNIGIPGRWHKIHESSKAVTIYDRLDESVKEDLQKEITQLIKNLRNKKNNNEILITKIENLLIEMMGEKELLDSKLVVNYDNQLRELIKEGENSSLWGEMVKVNFLRKELIYFISSGNYSFAPLFHFYPPEYPENNALSIETAEIKFNSYSNQSRNLQQFMNLTIKKRIQEKLYEKIEKLKNCRARQNRIILLDEISTSFEKMRDDSRRFYMGDNLTIPNEKGDDIALFYHNIYLLFGKALCDIENRYRRTLLGIIPLISERAQKQRIKILFNNLHIFINGEPDSIWKKKFEKIKTLGGKCFTSGLASTVLILFLTGSLLNFFTIKPGDQVICGNLRIGYLGKFINHETIFLEYGDFLTIPFTDKQLGWHMPPPLSRHSIINDEERELIIYMIMGEHQTANPINKLIYSLSGQLGTKFDVIVLKLKYVPFNAENWSRYNIDGKGDRRLIRDISELAEEWRENKRSSLEEISNEDFDNFFRRLSEKGAIEDYIKRSFSQTTFSTNIYYGSLSERFESGFTAVLSEFENQINESESNLFLNRNEKEEFIENLENAYTIVEELQKRIEEQVTIEYNQLRSNPEILNKLVRKPYDNIQKLKDFETLWINIANYTKYLYNQQKIMGLLSSGEVDMKNKLEALEKTPGHLELAEYIQNNSLIKKLIEIRSIKFSHKIIGLTEFSRYQELWKETI